MENIVDKEQKEKSFSNEQKSAIAKKISDDWQVYEQARSSNLAKARQLIAELYFNRAPRYKDESDKWKSDVKLCKLYMFYQTLKAYIWKNSYSSINSMFNVSGESLEADSDSNKQKTMLVDKLDKMGYIRTSDEVIDYSMPHGEFISFITWKKRSEEYRRPITFFETMNTDIEKLPKILEAKAKGKNYFIDERIIYNDPYVYSVDPFEFNFDTSQEDNFDAAPKILRTWKTVPDILNNRDYKLSAQEREDIKKIVPKTADIGENASQEVKDENNAKHINGTTVEVLEFFGDFTDNNGEIYRNWYAVVIAGKYLAQFCKNPLVINPFTFYAPLKDPNTGRGISLLYAAYSLSLKQEELMNKTVDLQSLIECPPAYTPKGFFKESKIKFEPGRIIEYDGNLFPNVPVTPISFDSSCFVSDVSFLDDVMSETTGIYPNMSGAAEKDRTTATEISVKTEGQLTRLQMILDGISQNYIIESVKKVAKLCANFKFGDENIFLNKDNNPENVVITDKIRQAEYRYTYSDRSALSERFNFADTTAQGCQMFQKAGASIDPNKTFIWWMEQKGVENPERFIANNQLPPELQQALIQNPELIEALMAQIPAQQQEIADVQLEQPQGQQGVSMQGLQQLPGM